MYKVYNDKKLSEDENLYLEAWKKEMNGSSTLYNDCLVPKHHTKNELETVSDKDLNTLNKLSLVELSKETHGKFSLNDLILELS